MDVSCAAVPEHPPVSCWLVEPPCSLALQLFTPEDVEEMRSELQRRAEEQRRADIAGVERELQTCRATVQQVPSPRGDECTR